MKIPEEMVGWKHWFYSSFTIEWTICVLWKRQILIQESVRRRTQGSVLKSKDYMDKPKMCSRIPRRLTYFQAQNCSSFLVDLADALILIGRFSHRKRVVLIPQAHKDLHWFRKLWFHMEFLPGQQIIWLADRKVWFHMVLHLQGSNWSDWMLLELM